jgi:uncharacterized repeat protein (TIGR03803 family)
VFEVYANGTGGTLWSFTGPDGKYPEASLVRDSTGTLYSTTTAGGASSAGTVFRLSTARKLTVLHSFTGSPDGASPSGGLVRDSSGNLCGTTYDGGTGGCNDGFGVGCGTIFEITSAGQESVLYSFLGTPDGSGPQESAMLPDSAGNLYGATVAGGTYGCGTVFKYTP